MHLENIDWLRLGQLRKLVRSRLLIGDYLLWFILFANLAVTQVWETYWPGVE